jgi:serine/threonine protein kinase
MIARHSHCNTTRLAGLLEESLSPELQLSVTQHLDSCEYCQHALQELAGDDRWWQDTRQVLSELGEPTLVDGSGIESAILTSGNSGPLRTADHGSNADGASRPSGHERPHDFDLQAVNHWVVGLLQASSDPTALGEVDGMPIYSVVGQGGMGVVLKAHDRSLQRFLAVKLLSPMLSSSGAARQRFFREAQAAAAVVHPNIVPIYAISDDRALPYIVMPFIAGGNLQQHLDAEGPLALDRVLSIGLQVAEGLAAAHAQGIIHRDIKPANLMLDEGGFRVMLTDFGLARALDDASLTGSGMIAGTPQYMSPEQARGKPLDARSDIYSLGALLYALATGRPPIPGGSAIEVLQQIGEVDPTPVYEINERYPKWFHGLVMSLMAKETSQRVGATEDVVQLLRGCLSHARSPHQAALPESIGRQERTTGSRLLRLFGLVIACAVGVGLTSLGWNTQWFNDGPPSENSAAAKADLSAGTKASGDADAAVQLAVAAEADRIEPLSANDPRQTKPDADTDWISSEVEALLSTAEFEVTRLSSELRDSHDSP